MLSAIFPRLLLKAGTTLVLSFVCLVALGWALALLPLLLMLHAICEEKERLLHLLQTFNSRMTFAAKLRA